ncbi:MAG: hypothetical protein R2774_12750 [Saprospiraceae bacterium]
MYSQLAGDAITTVCGLFAVGVDAALGVHSPIPNVTITCLMLDSVVWQDGWMARPGRVMLSQPKMDCSVCV